MNTLTQQELKGLAFEPHQPETESLDLVRYWRAVARNKWRILALVVLVGSLATLYAFSLTPVYRATATVLVEGSRQKAVSMEDLYVAYNGSTTRDYYLTQFEIFKSRDAVERLVRVMGLAKYPEFDPRQQPKPWYAALLPGVLSGGKGVAATDQDIEEGVVDRVLRQISLQPVRNTQLLKVSFDSFDPDIAARVPNTLAIIYIVADMEARVQETQRTTQFLAKRSEDLKAKLSDSEQALQQFREREKIVEAKGVSLAGAGRQLEDLTSSLVEARRKRAELEALYNQINAARQGNAAEPVDTLPVVLRHPLVQRFKEIETEAERRLSDASKRYGAEHPQLVAAQADLKSAQDNLKRQISQVVQGVSKDYELARANEIAIERALEQSKGNIQSENRKEFELQSLERDVAANRQLYDTFMQRSKEVRAGDMQSPIARVVDEARPPKGPYGPNKRLIVSLSVLAALLAGISLALLIERLNNTVKASHEVETKLGIRAIGVLPVTRPEKGVSLERMFRESNQNAFSEAIRTIRSSVLLSGLQSPRKVVLLTSSVPDEGKTTLACNLGFAMSQVKKTLLLEADMRRPKLARVLGEDRNRPGLAELMADDLPIEQCVYQVADSKLYVMQAGRVPPNPLELLSSPRLAQVIEKLKEEFEVIVIDSPPVQLVSDAVMLAQLATSVLFVVRADSTPYPIARHALNRLHRADAPVLGAVLNQIDLEKADNYYGEYSGYGNRYYRKYGYYTQTRD
ncbi:MAG TPA: polysaccharide biosynthesis tyrosine autokinase [Burkholderiales bacterium]|nr:polysaccharide biosynthesis tyrosine autokinase [Burkholderiales bacterium]